MITFPAKFNNHNALTVPAGTETSLPQLAPEKVYKLPRNPKVIKSPIAKFDFKHWHLIAPKLKERERKVIEARFGIKQKQISSLQELGDELNLSKERVRQIQNAGLRKAIKFSEEIKLQGDGRSRIDPDILTTAMVEGRGRADAVDLAGSQASPQTLSASASQVLSRPGVKAMLLRKLEEKKEQILNALTNEKADEATYLQLITSLGIVIDKSRLLEGEATTIIQQMPRMVIRGNEVSFDIPITPNVD